jgi:hypothetical protein
MQNLNIKTDNSMHWLGAFILWFELAVEVMKDNLCLLMAGVAKDTATSS